MAGGEVLAVAGLPDAQAGGFVVADCTGCAELWRRLHTDPLTLLANRAALYAEMDRRVGEHQGYTLAILDLDQFKAVNDRFGHDIGDWLLFEVAARLRAVCAVHGWIPARLHGDEFAVVLPAMSGEQATVAAWMIHDALAQGMVLMGQALFLWSSVGITVATSKDDPADVRRRADVAMYRAKKSYAGIDLFDPAVDVLPPREQSRPSVRHRDLAAAVTALSVVQQPAEPAAPSSPAVAA